MRQATEKICENLHIVANEPSLALYRISEHVRKVSQFIFHLRRGGSRQELLLGLGQHNQNCSFI